MPKKNRKRGTNKAVDLDENISDYEPSESEDEFDQSDKILLEKRKGKKEDSEEEVLGIHSSSDDDEDDEEGGAVFFGGGEEVGSDFDSDIGEGGAGKEDDLPDTKAWGKKAGRFYNTDYVDKDYGGFSKDEEEIAMMEEQEALAIQRRLAEQLLDTDFTLGLLDKVEEKKAELDRKMGVEKSGEGEKIRTDLTALSDMEKVEYLKKESPEFFPLIEDFKKRLRYANEVIVPIQEVVKKKSLPICKITKFLQLLYRVTLNYCTNITFYLLLKSKRLPVEKHLVAERIYTLKKLLEKLDAISDKGLGSKVEELLKKLEKGDEFEIEEEKEESKQMLDKHGNPMNRKQRRKKMLELLEKRKKKIEKVQKILQEKEEVKGEVKEKKVRFTEPSSGEEDEEAAENEKEIKLGELGGVEGAPKEEKRAITYQMAKNKGLTPKRKKEQRNPRVKHRNKYKKAKIRRKGQIREVRKELTKYGGEISGIKKFISKSIKLK